jgi:hypothetical protein
MASGLAGLAAVMLGSAPGQEEPVRFGAWAVHHFDTPSGPTHEHGARAALLTDDGFISVECPRRGSATLMVAWVPNIHLGSPDDYTPREVTVRWDGGAPSAEPWEAFVGAAFRRDDAYARGFADRLGASRKVTLSAMDDAGVRREQTYDLGPAEDTRAALARVQADCRGGGR